MSEKDIKYIMERYNVDFASAYGISGLIQKIMKERNINIESACNIYDSEGSSIRKEQKLKSKNIYQIVAIIFAVLVVISTIAMGADNTMEGSVPFVFLFGGLTFCLFMYGFGEIIKNTKSCKEYLNDINSTLKKSGKN